MLRLEQRSNGQMSQKLNDTLQSFYKPCTESLFNLLQNRAEIIVGKWNDWKISKTIQSQNVR